MKRIKGLYKDTLSIDQPAGTYREAKNININDDIGSISSEQGIEEILSTIVDKSFVPLAYETAPNGNIVIWYVTDTISGIGIFDGETFDASVLQDADLNFNFNSKLDTTVRLSRENEIIAYWTDNIEPPRNYNLTSKPTFADINELNIFDFIASMGKLGLNSVNNSGGSLFSGAYVFALRYVDEDGNTTNFFDITRPINVIRDTPEADGFVEGTPTVRTTKSIRLDLDNLDTTYDFAQVAVIRFEESTIAETTLLPKIIIPSSGTGLITYTGQSFGIDIALEEIVINKVSYSTAKTITQLDDVLYMANLTRSSEVDYQKYANNIKTYLTSKTISDLDHGQEEFTYTSKSFRRGEVYAFYISFLLKDGTETEAFHIPGREAVGTELSAVDETGTGNERGDIYSGASQFQFYAKADPTYGMAYWQEDPSVSGGAYPNNPKFDIVNIDANGDDQAAGTLRNDPVRHHRFPDEFDQPVISSVTGRETDVTVLGVKFQDVKIPPSLKPLIKGVKFYYAEKNSNNRLMIDESFAVGQEPISSTQWSVIEDFLPLYRNAAIEDPYGDTNYLALSLTPFSSMLNRTNISGVNYLIRNRIPKITFARRCSYDDQRGNAGHDYIYSVNDLITPADVNVERASAQYIKKVEDISYYDGLTDVIPLLGFGFESNKSSYIENSGIIIERFSALFDITYNGNLDTLLPGDETYTLNNEFGAIYTMCSFRTTVHSPFSQQTLVSMGEFDADIDNYDPTDVGFTNGATRDFYSGDTFINRIGTLIAFDRTSGAQDIDQALVYTVVQSYDNIAWRQSGPDLGDFNPNNQGNEEKIIEYYRKQPIEEFSDNYYEYDPAHSVQATTKTTVPDQEEDINVNTLPTRVIRSAEQNPETREDSFRIFLENDYLDLPADRGVINRLATNNNILIVHSEKALYQTRGKEELATGDFRAFLGSGDIFEIQPSEIYNTKHGFAGIQDADSAIETKAGYFFVDSYSRKPYLLQGKIQDLSEVGMKQFFRENLKWYIDELKSHDEIHHTGIVSEYDEMYDRILLTKVDYEPTALTLADGSKTFNPATGKFTISDGEIIAEREYTNSEFFTDKSFTISYMPQINAWVSLHDYKPLFYLNDGYNLYSITGDQLVTKTLNLHNSDNVGYCNFYGTDYPMHFQFVENPELEISKQLVNIEFITEAYDRANDKELRNITFDRFQIRNGIQNSDIQSITVFTSSGGNARNVEGSWRINNFRDLTDANGDISGTLLWHEKKRFIGKYAIIDLYYDTPNNTKLSLVSAKANFKQSIR